MPGSPPIQVFVAYDFAIGGALPDCLASVSQDPPPGFEVHWPGAPGGKAQGEIWRDIVKPGIENCERFLAFLDLPNANVGFEIGYALGKGKQVALGRMSPELPAWIQAPPLKGFMCSHFQDVGSIYRTIEGNDWTQLRQHPQAGKEVLILCPEVKGQQYLKRVKDEWGWRKPPVSGWNLRDLPERLAGVGLVLWFIAPHNDGEKERDGKENAALSVIAGYAAAHPEIAVRVFTHKNARPVADILVHSVEFDLNSFENLATRSVEDWRKGRERRAAPVPPITPTPSATDGTGEVGRAVSRAYLPPLPQRPSAPVIGAGVRQESQPAHGPTSIGRWLKVGVASLAVALGAGVWIQTHRQTPEPTPEVTKPTPAPAAPAPSAVPRAATPMDMVPVLGGTFMMGSTEGDGDEKPVHSVTLSSYEIDKTEVTAAQYRECVESGKCKEEPGSGGKCTWKAAGKEDHPINCVTWDQAVAYCHSQQPPKELPTEAQWEFAARGSEGRKYPWRDEFGGHKVCWNRDSTCPAGSYPTGRTPLGVLDMAGNVWEWTADWYGPYPGRPETDPRGPEKGTARVVRGGSWSDVDPSWFRGANRFRSGPWLSGSLLGFRCARGVKTE